MFKMNSYYFKLMFDINKHLINKQFINNQYLEFRIIPHKIYFLAT